MLAIGPRMLYTFGEDNEWMNYFPLDHSPQICYNELVIN